jgi:hypothetical protein
VTNKAQISARHSLAQNISPAPELKRALAHVGLFSRVAEKVGITPSHVLRVAKGERQSKRVVAAVVSEVRRIERDIARSDRGTGDE